MSAELKKALLGVATTAITAIGTIGFVAFTGAAIAWVRFYSAQLPADQAVAAIPRSELVAIGGAALVLFVLLGLAAVLFLYVVDSDASDVEGVRWALLLLAVLEVLVAIAITVDGDDAWEPSLKAGAFVIGMALITFVTFLWKRTSEWSGTKPRGAGDGLKIWELAKYRSYRRKLKVGGWLIMLGAIVAVVWVTPQIAEETIDGRWAAAAVIAVAVVLGVANFAVAHATGNRFWGAAIAVFFSVLIFGAVLAGARTFQAPLVQPAALIRSADLQPEGILGLYVTETDDRVWFGAVCQQENAANRPKPNSGRLFWVPRKDLVAMSVGPLQRMETALENSPKLLDSLVALRIPAEKQAARAARRPLDEPPVRAFDACEPVRNKPPTIAIAIRRLAGAPRLYLLDASRSSDRDGSVNGFSWSLPDGRTRTESVIPYRVPRNGAGKVVIALAVTDDSGEVTRATVELQPPIAARALFRIDRAKLRPGARARLRTKLWDVLAGGTKNIVLVQVDGHTDSTGGDAHNQDLSERRAAAVVRFLRELLKIDDKRIRPPRGFGERVPLASNETRAGRRKNRRVEVLVVRRSG